MAERSGLGLTLAFILLRVLSPAENSLHLAGNELPSLSTVPWVCQPGAPAAHHGPCHHPQEHSGTGTPSFPTSPPCSLGWTTENLYIGLWLGWRGQWHDRWTGVHFRLRLVAAGAGEDSVHVPSPSPKPSPLSIPSPSTAAPQHPSILPQGRLVCPPAWVVQGGQGPARTGRPEKDPAEPQPHAFAIRSPPCTPSWPRPSPRLTDARVRHMPGLAGAFFRTFPAPPRHAHKSFIIGLCCEGNG